MRISKKVISLNMTESLYKFENLENGFKTHLKRCWILLALISLHFDPPHVPYQSHVMPIWLKLVNVKSFNNLGITVLYVVAT